MKVSFSQTGGFAGLRREATLDSEQLSAEDNRALHDLVQQAGFFELPPKLAPPQPGADRLQYNITVEANDRRHTVEVSDEAVPAQLQPLLEHLKANARPAPLKRSGGSKS